MYLATKVRPVNSLLFISDPNGGEPPIPVRNTRIRSTSSCISVSCSSEQDGPTEVILGMAQEVDPGTDPVFDRDLETPNRAVVVSTVERETVLEAKVPGKRTHVRIWVNHPRWADKVIVGLG
jgi:hypothetical protein